MKYPAIEAIAQKKSWTARDLGRAYLHYYADAVGQLDFLEDATEPTGLISLDTLQKKLPGITGAVNQATLRPYMDTATALTGVFNYIRQTADTLDVAIRSQRIVNLFIAQGQAETVADLVAKGDADTLTQALDLFGARDSFSRLNDLAIQESVRYIYAYNRIIKAIAAAHEVPHLERLTVTTRREERLELEAEYEKITEALDPVSYDGYASLLGGAFAYPLENYAGTEEDHQQLTRTLRDLTPVTRDGFFKAIEAIAGRERDRETDAKWQRTLEEIETSEAEEQEGQV